jgi:hypothetical protein
MTAADQIAGRLAGERGVRETLQAELSRSTFAPRSDRAIAVDKPIPVSGVRAETGGFQKYQKPAGWTRSGWRPCLRYRRLVPC